MQFSKVRVILVAHQLCHFLRHEYNNLKLVLSSKVA